jgi:hypothetical protein
VAKAQQVRQLDLNALQINPETCIADVAGLPGRPDRPLLVPPHQLKPRSPGTREGLGAMIHALAHIEANAINLALDVSWRFAGMPERFYREWLQVAREEALHFELLREHLLTLGFEYGDFPAHNGLWEMAQKTQGSLLARLALVPRTLEARGLDASIPITTGWCRSATIAARPSLTSSCATKLAMWPWATIGSVICVQPKTWTRSAPSQNWQSDMVHKSSRDRSTWRRAGPPALTRPNWRWSR